MRFKEFLALELRPDLRVAHGLSRTNFVVIVLILFGALLAILETEPVLSERWGTLFLVFEGALFLVFLAEYIGRVYTANYPDLQGNIRGRIRYIFSLWALLDLLVLISFVMMLGGSTLFFVRVFRLIRIVRIARLGRFSKAIDLVLEAVSARKFEMALTFGIALGLMVLGASVLYVLEGQNQPEVFGSIPRALWWSVATLTTVGYGDVVPVTVLGKIVAGITAMLGVGLVAMPAGILASAFSEAIQKRKQAEKERAQPNAEP